MALIYLGYLSDLEKYIPVKIDVNNSFFRVHFLNLVNQFRFSRLASFKLVSRILKSINTDEIALSRSKMHNYDLIFCSYIYPKFIGKGNLPPVLLKIHYLTDRYLKHVNDGGIALRKNMLGLWENFDAIIPSTKFSVNEIVESDHRLKGKVFYCPLFLPSLKEASGRVFESKIKHSKKIRLIFVGRDGERKGLKELLVALHELPNGIKERIVFTFITESKLNKNLINNIEHKHHFSLKHDSVLNEIENNHVFVLPTKRDTYGIVFIEAMSKGCAIIADDDLPRLEFVGGNQSGICVNPEKVDQIRWAIEKMVLDDEFRNSCMKNSLNAFKNQFAPDVVAKRHQEIFEEVINKYKKDNAKA